jgi:hypothetical protein
VSERGSNIQMGKARADKELSGWNKRISKRYRIDRS